MINPHPKGTLRRKQCACSLQMLLLPSVYLLSFKLFLYLTNYHAMKTYRAVEVKQMIFSAVKLTKLKVRLGCPCASSEHHAIKSYWGSSTHS